jgi:hypothetical protein
VSEDSINTRITHLVIAFRIDQKFHVRAQVAFAVTHGAFVAIRGIVCFVEPCLISNAATSGGLELKGSQVAVETLTAIVVLRPVNSTAALSKTRHGNGLSKRMRFRLSSSVQASASSS